MKVAIVGVRGIPNNYGGFETLAEYLVEYLSKEIEFTVYCSSIDMENKVKNYKNANLKYIPISSHGAWGLFYDSISFIHSLFTHDKVLFLGFGAGFVSPFLRRHKSKIILNFGGLDWKRNKWSPRAQTVIKKAEALLIMNSGQIISDNIGIQNYILNEYGKQSTLIAYGGDQAQKQSITDHSLKEYPFLNKPFAFIVTRIQADNNIDMLLEAFQKDVPMPIVMVGNWMNSKYGRDTKSKWSNNSRLILLDAIYDRQRLDVLRSNCTIYIHGHSAGGTNPSLVEAMYLGLPIFAYASGYNEYTTEQKALYFKTAKDLNGLVRNYKSYDLENMGSELNGIASTKYTWKIVSESYKELFLN